MYEYTYFRISLGYSEAVVEFHPEYETEGSRRWETGNYAQPLECFILLTAFLDSVSFSRAEYRLLACWIPYHRLSRLFYLAKYRVASSINSFLGLIHY